MTPNQKETAIKAFRDLRTISIVLSEPHDVRSFSEVLDAGGIKFGFIDFNGGSATGFSANGIAAIAALAKSYRLDGNRQIQRASNATLTKFLSALIASLWKGRDNKPLEDSDFDAFDAAVERWYSQLAQAHLHAIPCILTTYHAPPFAVGPVHFYCWSDFPTERFFIAGEKSPQNAAEEKSKSDLDDFHFGNLREMARERNATWAAVVEIHGRAKDDSISIADIAVDIALSALQIAAPGLDVKNISRASARVPLLWRADVLECDGQIQAGTTNCSPALCISPEVFAEVVELKVNQSLAVMGRRLADYLGLTSSLPLLNESWCNAAYWFHEAVAETLDTVAVVKLETAIEVLFRAENMSGSKSRIAQSFDVVFGLTSTDSIPGSNLTVNDFILNITTARSRIVHGTWPTIHTDLPGYRAQQPVSRAEVETVARMLLIKMAYSIDEYAADGQLIDDIDELIRWTKSRGLLQTASAAPPTST